MIEGCTKAETFCNVASLDTEGAYSTEFSTFCAVGLEHG